MDVLDAGCGVGSIALDLAQRVAPGRVVGVDFDPGQIEVAQRSAAARGLDNAEFFTASVYELPFADASFDVTCSVAVLMYLREPVRALAEMRRILRPDGLAAVTDDDRGTVVISPDRPELRLIERVYQRAVVQEGGNPRRSPDTRALMLEAGFARSEGVAHAPQTYGDGASTRWFAQLEVDYLRDQSTREQIVAAGWASLEELDTAAAAWEEWADHPAAFHSVLYCGALGWTT
jgi:ubiquinone/menaquinone biosynthesis C-methylase UbiE